MKNLGFAITAISIALMLLGSFVLDNTPLTIGAAVLMVVGGVLMPREEGWQGLLPLASLVATAATVVVLRAAR